MDILDDFEIRRLFRESLGINAYNRMLITFVIKSLNE